MKIVLIACSGAIGSVLRYLLATFVQNHAEMTAKRWVGHALPVGTLTVNFIGCFLIGILASLFARHAVPNEQYRVALMVGLLGGFTTFSAFGLDTFVLLQRGYWPIAIMNVLVSCAGGLAAVWIGYYAVDRFLDA
jgi:CrcB protein